MADASVTQGSKHAKTDAAIIDTGTEAAVGTPPGINDKIAIADYLTGIIYTIGGNSIGTKVGYRPAAIKKSCPGRISHDLPVVVYGMHNGGSIAEICNGPDPCPGSINKCSTGALSDNLPVIVNIDGTAGPSSAKQC